MSSFPNNCCRAHTAPPLLPRCPRPLTRRVRAPICPNLHRTLLRAANNSDHPKMLEPGEERRQVQGFRCVVEGGIGFRNSKDMNDRYDGCMGPEHLECIAAIDCGDGWLSVPLRGRDGESNGADGSGGGESGGGSGGESGGGSGGGGSKFVPIEVPGLVVFEPLLAGSMYHPASASSTRLELPSSAVEEWLLPPPPAALHFLGTSAG